MTKTPSAPAAGWVFFGGLPWLDFVNTLLKGRGQVHDALPDFERVLAWLVAAHLLEAHEVASARERWGGPRHAQALIEEVRGLRVTLRELAEHIADGDWRVPAPAIAAINRVLRAAPGYPQLVERAGRLEQRGSGTLDDPLGLLAGVARSAADFLTQADFSLLKRCDGHECVLLFYDTTKNHARRFCSVEICGNRYKAAARYQRLKQQKEARGRRR